MRPYPVEELLIALRAEILSARRGSGETAEKVALHGGARTGGDGKEHEYVFSCKAWREGFDRKRLVIRLSRSRQPWLPAEVSRMPDGKVRVSTVADLGASPGNVLLREDDAAGWEVLAERLEEIGEQHSPVDPNVAGWLLGRGSPKMGRATDPARWVANWPRLRLNQRQREAIEFALASQVLFLWGPPGTGKTDVVSHIVEGCYRQGLSVVFVAPTNVAVDQAVERICGLLAEEDGFDCGLVQRAGDIAVASLHTRYGEQVSPERVAARLAAELDVAITQASEQLRAAQAAIVIHDEALSLSNELETGRGRHRAATTEAATANRQAVNAEAQVARYRAEIAKIGDPTGLFGKRKADRLALLQQQLSVAGRMAGDAWHRQRNAEAEQITAAADISEVSGRLAAVRSRLAGVPPRPQLVRQAEQLRNQLDALDQQRRRIQDTVRSRCRVIGATVSRAVQSRKLLDRIDVVVIDEAGMVDLPSVWYAAGLADKRVVVAGDFRQLPAVTKAAEDRSATEEEREHCRQWMDRDAFSAAGLVGPLGSVRRHATLVGLDTQYRMRKPICGLVNIVAYPDAPLVTGRDDTSRLPSSALLEAPVVLVNTSTRRIQVRARNSHKTNPVHEAVIHELVRGLQYDGALPGRKWADLVEGERPPDRLAVIAPYRDQVRSLQASLKYRFGEHYEGVVDTVHRFQGSQRPLVVIDTVAGAGDRPGYFYDGTGLSSKTCRLLNVALSRAQDHLVVVADVEHLREHLPPHSEAVRMLDYLERHARQLLVDDLVPIREASDLAGLSEDELARPAFFPADEVRRAVEWDIDRATTSIDVYCAFLDPNPVHYWLRRLADRIAQGVQVTVFTRDPRGDAGKAALVEQLRAGGCRVDVRERMHEKVMILDAAVLWHGSLNLLANSGPTDLMMRITDPSSCERVRRIMDRARMERPLWDPRAHKADGRTSGPRSSDGLKPGDVANGRLYLDVAYADRQAAKRELRAQWDGQARLWWVDAQRVSREQAKRWLPADE
jgi:hypothetical protein